ncbi:MAG: TolC family protein [Candidatus Margulisiibacteriota bacterium]|jgi:outer membrane protein TolC
MLKISGSLIFLLLLFTCFTVEAKEKLTLKEAINLTLKNNLSLNSEKDLLQKAVFEQTSKEQEWLPNLSLNMNYYYINKKAAIVIPAPISQSFNLGDNNNFNNNLNLNYVIYNFAKEPSIQIKRLQKAAQTFNINQKAKSLSLQTITLYKSLETCYLQQMILIKGKEKLQNELLKIDSLIRNGAILPVEALTIKIAIANFDQYLLDIENKIKFVKDQMFLLTNERFEIQVNPIIIKLDLTNKELTKDYTLASLDLANNERIKILTLQKEILENQKQVILAQNYPAFGFNSSFNYSKPGVDPIKNNWMDYFTVGVGLKWQLFDWGSVQNQAQAEDKAIDSLNKEIALLINNVNNEYQNKVREYDLLKNQLTVAKKVVDLTEEKIKLFDAQLKNGAISITDFRDTMFELTQNKLNYFQDYINLSLKSIEVDYLSGLPIEKWRLEE